jgi:hypothetical protein
MPQFEVSQGRESHTPHGGGLSFFGAAGSQTVLSNGIPDSLNDQGLALGLMDNFLRYSSDALTKKSEREAIVGGERTE